MKKLIVCLVAIFAVLLFGGLTSVYAFPYIEVEGFVNPGEGVVGATTTVFDEVIYTFKVVDAASGAEMNYLSLEFENDVFESFGPVTSSMPADWAYSLIASTLSIYQEGDAGTTIGMGEQLMFTMSDVVVYNEALVPGNLLWQEGKDIWGQSWTATDTETGGDGGSTALVPEPGTLLLFGSGLVGLFYVRRTKAFNI